jgi:hypothetical protein
MPSEMTDIIVVDDNQVLLSVIAEIFKVRLDSRLTQRWARLFSKQTLLRAARVMGPTLVALTLAGVANTARAQGTISFSGAQTFMQTVQTFAIYAGAVICFGGLIFAGIRMMSGRFRFATQNGFGSVGWHTFRHTYRTLLSGADTPIDVQQKLLRHAQISTTQQYGGPPMENQRRANSEVVRKLLFRKSAG